MVHPLVDAFVLYFLGLVLAPNLKAGSRLRRLCELVYWPFVKLGLWYRWSMYAPEVPGGTQIALAAVVFADGSSEIVELPGLDDGAGFGKARGLRFVALQWALADPLTDYMKPALCDYALRAWRAREPAAVAPGDAGAGGARPVAVEIRVHWYRSPEPGRRERDPVPEVRTVWRREVAP